MARNAWAKDSVQCSTTVPGAWAGGLKIMVNLIQLHCLAQELDMTVYCEQDGFTLVDMTDNCEIDGELSYTQVLEILLIETSEKLADVSERLAQAEYELDDHSWLDDVVIPDNLDDLLLTLISQAN